MFLAVGETHGTMKTKNRISSNNLFLLSSEGGREEKELKRLGTPPVKPHAKFAKV